LAKVISGDPKLRGPKLLLLSSLEYHIEPIHLAAIGIAEQMTKPIRQTKLFDTIMNLFAEEQAGQRPPSVRISRDSVDRAGARILVAEDNVVNQIVMSEILNTGGYSFDIVSDGVSAVEAALTGKY